MDQYEMFQEEEQDYINLRVLIAHAWQGFKKFWWAIPIMFFLCIGGASYYKIHSYVPIYQAKGTFTVSTKVNQGAGDADASYEFFYNKGAASQMAVTFPYILQSEVFQQVLKQELGTDMINGELSVEAIPDTNLFTMTVTSNSAEDAYQIVEAVMKNYPTVAKYVIGDTKLTMLQEPVKPDSPMNTSSMGKRGLVKCGMLGLLLGLLPIGIYAITRKQIHSREDIKEYLNMPCIGTVCKVAKKKRSKKKNNVLSIHNHRIDASFVKAIKRVAYRVGSELDKNEEKVLVVTSTNPNEGKSTISYNLVQEFVNQGRRAVLIHGDFRKIKDTNSKNNPNCLNLSSFLENPKLMVAKMEENRNSEVAVELMMKENTKNPIKLLQSKEMKQLIEELRKAGEYVIIDAPPVGLMADAVILARYADGVIYVIRQDYMNRGQILNAMSSLAAEECKVYGCLLNYATEKPVSEYGHYKEYGMNA